MTPVSIRWMIRRDLAEVLDIEHLCFPNPWSEEDFIRCLRQRNCIGMVAETLPPRGVKYGQLLGFMVYELHKTRLRVLNFAVHPRSQRQGIGTAMADKLKSKLSTNHRTRLTLDIRETNLAAQLFFRAQGFRAVNMLHGWFEDTDEAAIVMQYAVQQEALV